MARALRAWRGTRTLAEMANAAHVNVDTLSDLEAGKIGRPRNKTLRALEDAYGRKEGELDAIAWDAEHPVGNARASLLDAELGHERASIIREVLQELAPERAPDIIARAEERFRLHGEGDGG
jgi:transcriptional regulator with XRE-family HTH domain